MLKHHNADIELSDGFELIVQTNLEVVHLTFYGSLTNTFAIYLLYIDTPIFFKVWMANSCDGITPFRIEIKSHPLSPSFDLVLDQNCGMLLILSPLKIPRFLYGEFL